MESSNGEKPFQFDLFPASLFGSQVFASREFPQPEGHASMEIEWIDCPYAWNDLDAEFLRFYAEFLRKGNRSLHDSFTRSLERDYAIINSLKWLE